MLAMHGCSPGHAYVHIHAHTLSKTLSELVLVTYYIRTYLCGPSHARSTGREYLPS